MAARRRRLKLFFVLLSVFLLLVLVIAALPLWFPWALRPIAKHYGATFATYHRVGYQRFEVSGVTFTNRNVSVNAQELTAFVPTVWLWHHLTGAKDQPFVVAKSWEYAPVPYQSPHTQSSKVSAYSVFGVLRNVASHLDNWLPTAVVTNGVVNIPGHPIAVSDAYWANGDLKGTVSISNEPPAAFLISTKPSSPWKLDVDSQNRKIHAALALDNREGKLSISGNVEWLTNRAAVDALFPPHGFVPDTASLRSDAFRVQAPWLNRMQYDHLEGHLSAAWQTNQFSMQMSAKGVPQSSNVPPVDIELRATGDTRSARLETARISIPGLRGELAEPAPFLFHSPFMTQPATLDVIADLDQQHWLVAQGRLAGRAIVYAGEKFPRVSFALSGAGVTTTSITSSNLVVTGEFNWPTIDITKALVTMDDGSRISVAGIFNIQDKTIRDGRLQSSGPFGGQYIPAGFSFDSASLSAQFNGPIASLTNSANITVQRVMVPGLNPFDVEAEGRAEGLNFKATQITLKAGSSSLQLRGATSVNKRGANLELSDLELSQSNRLQLRLQQPVQIAFHPVQTNAPWMLKIEPMTLAGQGGSVQMAASVEWPEQGSFQCVASGLDAHLIKDFITQSNIETSLNHLDLSGGWTNGPLEFQLNVDASLRTRENLPFSANARLSGGKSGVLIEQFSVSSATQAVCSVEGSLPVFLDPSQKDGLVQIDTVAPLKLRLSTDPESVLWEKIASAAGLKLQEPNLAAKLDGTWAKPEGEVTVKIQRIELARIEHPLPSVENLDFAAVMDRTSARISRCNFQIEKQPVSVTGQIPLSESFWSGLRKERKLPDWHDATAHLKIVNAQLAAFSSFFPQFLSPSGSANADISLEQGGNLRGQVSVSNARTYPLESIGPVRNIQLLARFDGRNVQLENASGEIGGQRVAVDGNAELSQQWFRTYGLPPFRVHLAGTNVPLARNPSVLLRADLDLAATNSGAEVPIISGKVTLRDSLYLADLQTLVPERTESARRRPPYFSVEADPWAKWRLKVNVQGNGFLRVQTPLFQGKVSTILSLEGTLKDPLALGQVKIDSDSTISFPFSSLDVKQGFVSLTSEDPYRPTLFVTAASRRFGYDVKMEATGPVDQPVVQFSSIPGLSSEEIVLMLTAGQIPRGLGVTTTTQQRAQGLALFVGKNILSDFGIGGTGADRLTMRTGQEISELGRPTYDIEYKLTDRLSVIGEYDRFDQYNLNVKYKIYSK